MRPRRASGLVGAAHTGAWFRAVRLHHAPTALNTAHTAIVATRFHAATIRPGFEVLYLAEDHLVALFEVRAFLGSLTSSYLPNPNTAFAIFPVQVNLPAVADLRDAGELRKLQTSVQELTGDWADYSRRNPAMNMPRGRPTRYLTEVPTQQLGHELFHSTRLEGFITYSARVPTHGNLVVFPTKLRPGSSIVYRDPAGKVIYHIP